ncbi:hypothetical protein IAT40_001187 [Kwoniella sp. CBS 6097]
MSVVYDGTSNNQPSAVAPEIVLMGDTKSDKMKNDLSAAEVADPIDVEEGNVKGTKPGVIVDAVWGEIDEDGPNYRSLGWIKAAVLQVKLQMGLGILGLPAVFDKMGFVPGIMIILAVFVICTWSDYVLGQFKRRHPEVYTLADASYLMFGPVGREIVAVAYLIQQIATGGAAFLSMTVAFNTITSHATCSVVWGVVSMCIVAAMTSIQTLGKISWLGWVGITSIMAAIITLMAGVGVSDRPSLAPPGDYTLEVLAVGHPSFVDAINAVCVVIFAYCAGPNFLNIIGEMREQGDYTKSILVSQGSVTVIYLIVASVVYHFVGQYIASPALGSAGLIFKKVCYGLALPGLAVGGTLFLHVSAKFIFVRSLRNSRHLSKNTPVHYIVWFSCVAGVCLIAFVIAEAIPFFNDLLSLIGALFATLMCIQLETYMWLWDNWHMPRTLRWKCLVVMNLVFHFLGWFCMVAGTYSSVVTINNNFKSGEFGSSFSCADNS